MKGSQLETGYRSSLFACTNQTYRCSALWEILISLYADTTLTSIRIALDSQQHMKSELGYMYIRVPDYLFLWFSMKGSHKDKKCLVAAQLNT